MRRSTVPPQTIIGYRRDGRPIRVIAGGAEEGGQGGAGGSEGGTGGSGDQGGTGGQQTGTQGGQQGGTENITDPAELHAIIARLQREAGDQRTKSRDQVKAQAAKEATDDLTQKIAAALGLAGGEKADPAELQRQIGQLQQDNTERDRELAIYRAALAPGMNVDAGRLLDSRSFMRSMRDIDPNDADAPEKIAEKIKAAVSSDPALQAARVSGGGSVGHAGGAGDRTNPDLSKLHGADLMEAAYAANNVK